MAVSCIAGCTITNPTVTLQLELGLELIYISYILYRLMSRLYNVMVESVVLNTNINLNT